MTIIKILFFKSSAICIFLSLIFACGSLSPKNSEVTISCPSTFDSLTGIYIYHDLDSLPYYKNGNRDVMDFFLENFKYPDQEFYQGSVNLEFIITDKGAVIGGRIFNKKESEYSSVDIESLRVLNSMDKWSPGKCNDVSLPSKMILPIRW